MLANRVREYTLSTGTGDITLAGALPGHIAFSDGFAVGDAVAYIIEDGDNYEIGTGTLAAAATLVRDEVTETLVDGVRDNAGPAPIALSGNAKVFCAATAEFLLSSDVTTDSISEVTPDSGVMIDGVQIKDGGGTFASPVVAQGGSVPFDTMVVQDTMPGTIPVHWHKQATSYSLQAGGVGNLATFDLTNLDLSLANDLTLSGNIIDVNSASDQQATLRLGADRSGSGQNIGSTEYMWDGNRVASVFARSASDTVNKDDADLVFATSPGSGGLTDRFELLSNGTADFLGNDVRGIDNLSIDGALNAKAPFTVERANGDRSIVASDSGVLAWNPDSIGGELSWDTGRAIVKSNTGNALSLQVGPTEFLLGKTDGSAELSGNVTILGGGDSAIGGLNVQLGAGPAGTTHFAYGSTDDNYITRGNTGITRFRAANGSPDLTLSDGIAEFSGKIGVGGSVDSGPAMVNVISSTETMVRFDRTQDANIDSVFNISVSHDGAPESDFMSFGAGSSALRVYGDNQVRALGEARVDGVLNVGGGNSIFSADYGNILVGDFVGGNNGITIQTPNTGRGGIAFSDGNTTAVASRQGRFDFRHDTDTFEWLTADSMRMSLSSSLLTVGVDATFNGNVAVTGAYLASLNGGMYGQSSVGSVGIAGGAGLTVGGNAVFYAQTHTTNANDIMLRSGTTVVGMWDDSADEWNLQGNNVTAGDAKFDGCSIGGNAVSPYSQTIYNDIGFHIRLENGGEIAGILLDAGGDLAFWAHGDTGDRVVMKTGSGSGTEVAAFSSTLFSVETETNFQGAATIVGKLVSNGGAKISVQNKVNGGSDHGVFWWDTDNGDFTTYMATAGGASIENGVACDPLNGLSGGFHIRNRVNGLNLNGFIWENNTEECLMSLTADTGWLHVKGAIHSENGELKNPSNTGNALVLGDGINKSYGTFEVYNTVGNAKHFDIDSTTGVANFNANKVKGNEFEARYFFRGVGTSDAIFSGGSNATSGSNIMFYGESHATQANDIRLRVGTVDRLTWDEDSYYWNFMNTPIIGVDEIVMTAASSIYRDSDASSVPIFGGDSITSGGGLRLYGGNHAIKPSDIEFYASASLVGKYDASNSTWDFQNKDITTTGNLDVDGVYVGGELSCGAPTELTISAGAVTVVKSRHTVDGEGDLADDLDTINGCSVGCILILSIADNSRPITFRDNTGNMRLAGDFIANSVYDRITLEWDGVWWCEVARSSNS